MRLPSRCVQAAHSAAENVALRGELAAAKRKLGLTEGELGASKRRLVIAEQELGAAMRRLGLAEQERDAARREEREKQADVSGRSRLAASLPRPSLACCVWRGRAYHSLRATVASAWANLAACCCRPALGQLPWSHWQRAQGMGSLPSKCRALLAPPPRPAGQQDVH